MKEEYFEIIQLFLQIIVLAISAFVLPKLRKFLIENTTEKERQNAIFWATNLIKIAEEKWKSEGKGKEKKAFVLEWLNMHKIKMTDEQLSILIDNIVDSFNKSIWKKENEVEK